MKRKVRSQSSGLFLFELIIAILFFSLASAVCVQIFVKSHLLSQQAQNLNYAVNLSSGAAQTINTGSSMTDILLNLETAFPTAVDTGSNISSAENTTAGAVTTQSPSSDTPAHINMNIYYNKKWNPCAEADAAYTMFISLLQEDTMVNGVIRIFPAARDSKTDDEMIYELSLTHHLQRRVS